MQISDGPYIGRGEGQAVAYHGETADLIVEQINRVKSQIENGLSRLELQSLMQPGGARNALDCALWDLETKRTGRRIWQLLGIVPSHLETYYTLGLDSPEATAVKVSAAKQFSKIKLKCSGTDDLARVRSVRAARTDADIIIDANQSWNLRQLEQFLPELYELKVRLIEQPLPAAEDDQLRGFHSIIPLCADEACQTSASIDQLVGKYKYINIKLDKTGGLTEALALAAAATKLGLKLMVGCMSGSSIAMAPAFVVGQYCDFVDLDGPLLATGDVANGIEYNGCIMSLPSEELWG